MSTPVSYVKTQLVQWFPIERYKKDRQLAFHHLLPSTQSDAFILNWLKTCTEKFHGCINFRDPVYGLAPLDVAILVDREVVVKALCETPGIKLDGVDSRGWSSKQHAVARNNPQILALVEKIAKQAFPFLRSVLQAQIPEGVVTRFRAENGTVRDMTQKEYREAMNGAAFLDGLMGTSDTLFFNWKSKGKPNIQALTYRPLFDAWQKRPPALAFSNEGVVGMGVRAAERINKGTLACIYGGALHSTTGEWAMSNYSNETTYGDKVSNYGVVIADGFPNVCQVPLEIDGVRFAGYLAVRDIAEGDQLVSDYAFAHRVKWGPREELNRDLFLKRFPKGTSLKDKWAKIEKAVQDEKKPLEFLQQIAELNYLYHTPSLLLSLIVRGHFHPKDALALFQEEKFVRTLYSEPHAAKIIISIYQKAFTSIEALTIGRDDREHIAVKLEKHVCAALVAIYLSADGYSQDQFDLLFGIAEKYLILESGFSRDEKGDIEALLKIPAEVRKNLIMTCMFASPVPAEESLKKRLWKVLL